MATEQIDPKLIDLVTNLDQALASLPQAEQEEYERCQQSVVDARRNANRIEGQIWIV